MEDAQWVGQSTMTGAHFGPCMWSGLWLLGVWSVVGLGLLSAVPNPDTTGRGGEVVSRPEQSTSSSLPPARTRVRSPSPSPPPPVPQPGLRRLCGAGVHAGGLSCFTDDFPGPRREITTDAGGFTKVSSMVDSNLTNSKAKAIITRETQIHHAK